MKLMPHYALVEIVKNEEKTLTNGLFLPENNHTNAVKAKILKTSNIDPSFAKENDIVLLLKDADIVVFETYPKMLAVISEYDIIAVM